MQDNFELTPDQQFKVHQEAAGLANQLSKIFHGKSTLLVFDTLCMLVSGLFNSMDTPDLKKELKMAFDEELNGMITEDKKDATH
jgi:hypothetical protein